MAKKYILKSKSSSLFLENNAQAGTVFRLMVDAIVGVAILMIILSSINYFNDLRIKTSLTEFNSLIDSAVNAPDGKIVQSSDLVFAKGAGFNAATLQSQTGVLKECFQFQSNLGFVEVTNNNLYASVTQNVETRVYAQCYPSSSPNNMCGSDADSCDICCLISFGKKLE